MRIRLLAIGKKMPAWVTQGFEDYQRRLTQDVSLELVALEAIKRTKKTNLNSIAQEESEALIKAANPKHYWVALDRQGQGWSTADLSGALTQWQHQGQSVDLFIGGPEGLSRSLLSRVSQCWSLSPLTLPHPLVRIIVAEQLYRAWSFLHHHPYHRDSP